MVNREEVTNKVTKAVLDFLRDTKLTAHLGGSVYTGWEEMLSGTVDQALSEYFENGGTDGYGGKVFGHGRL